MKIIALIPNSHYAPSTDQTWIWRSMAYGIIYSLEEWERNKFEAKDHSSRTLSVDNEFNVITPQ